MKKDTEITEVRGRANYSFFETIGSPVAEVGLHSDSTSVQNYR